MLFLQLKLLTTKTPFVNLLLFIDTCWKRSAQKRSFDRPITLREEVLHFRHYRGGVQTLFGDSAEPRLLEFKIVFDVSCIYSNEQHNSYQLWYICASEDSYHTIRRRMFFVCAKLNCFHTIRAKGELQKSERQYLLVFSFIMQTRGYINIPLLTLEDILLVQQYFLSIL